ncbi:MAG TPA: hypothetical protein VI316_10890 [Candidatus Dormibacteraeota bacterium]
MSLSLLAALLAGGFAAVVARRWRRSRRPAFAAWAAGLLVFAIAAGAQAVAEHSGFTQASFRVFYLFGGVLGVAYLGLGTIDLLAPPRVARACTVGLLVLSGVAVVAVAVVPVDAARLQDGPGFLGEAIGGSAAVPLRALAALLNIAGTLALVGGSAWSAYHFWRDGAGVDRVLCNVLLTAGALVIAVGLSAARLSSASASLQVLGAYEAVGITLMFAGFLCLGRVGAAHSGARDRPPGASRVQPRS